MALGGFGFELSDHAASPPRVWFPWMPGPEAGTTGPVHVSLTDFRVERWSDVAGIYRAGLRLRAGWYAVPGAVGVWLWTDFPGRRFGSLSVWTGPAELRGWVALPLHVQIMKKYRDRGALSSHLWTLARCDLDAISAEARSRLTAAT